MRAAHGGQGPCCDEALSRSGPSGTAAPAIWPPPARASSSGRLGRGPGHADALLLVDPRRGGGSGRTRTGGHT